MPFRVSRVSGAHLRGFAPGRPTLQVCSSGESLATCVKFNRLERDMNPIPPAPETTTYQLCYLTNFSNRHLPFRLRRQESHHKQAGVCQLCRGLRKSNKAGSCERNFAFRWMVDFRDGTGQWGGDSPSTKIQAKEDLKLPKNRVMSSFHCLF